MGARVRSLRACLIRVRERSRLGLGLGLEADEHAVLVRQREHGAGVAPRLHLAGDGALLLVVHHHPLAEHLVALLTLE